MPALTLQRRRALAALAAAVGAPQDDAPEQGYVRPFELISPADRAKVPAGVADAYPLSRVQAGMVAEMTPTRSCASTTTPRRSGSATGGRSPPTAFREAAAILVARHEALRTAIDKNFTTKLLHTVHGTGYRLSAEPPRP